jgi:hypothetical protein
MGNARARIAAADVDHPFAEDRPFDQRFMPHRLADRRACKRNFAHRVDRNHGDVPGGQHLDIMVCQSEQ